MRHFNSQLFSSIIKAKRGKRGLRTIAISIDVSPSTLSRIENEKLPDVETFIKICKWLDVPADLFVIKN